MEKPGSFSTFRILTGVVSVSRTILHKLMRTSVWIVSGFSGLVTGVLGTVLYKRITKSDSDPSPDPAIPKTDDMKQTVAVLETLKTEMETLKTEMENQMDEVKQQLDEVDEEKKKNKEKLQEVEKELKEKENYDKPEELLKKQEELLRTEWRLDEKKRNLEKQQSNLIKLMDPVETLVTRITRDPQWTS